MSTLQLQSDVRSDQQADKVRVLILDEDRIILQSLGQFLRREGYEVRTADSAEEALNLMAGQRVDLLLADINMPGLKPAEFLRGIRKRFPQVVTIVITGYGSIEGAVEATKLGAFDYLTKPIVDDEIRVVVEKAARQQALLFENQTLKQQLDLRFGLENVIGHDHQMLRVFDLVDAVADSRTTVLMAGESGTGKSLIARAIHHRSPRRDKPFIEVSCGAPPETLLESELFGHMRGAFTGAVADKPGRFLAADGGTLFLDEINSASPMMQVKLLRVLQEKTFEPVGSTQTIHTDVRIILASNADLGQLVAEGKFRQDLFYRINVMPIRLPSLRQRAGDIQRLSLHFLRQFASEAGREIIGFTEEAAAALQRYSWPGNVRELENAIEHAVVLCRRPRIDVEDLPEMITSLRPAAKPQAEGEQLDQPMPLLQALEIPERRIIEAALKRHNFNRQATAAELDINRTTLYKKMRKYGLDIGEPVEWDNPAFPRRDFGLQSTVEIFMATTLLADPKGRITLGKEYAGQTLLAETDSSGVVTLRPAVTVPADEAWLWENKKALQMVMSGIREARSGKRAKGPNMTKASKLASKITD